LAKNALYSFVLLVALIGGRRSSNEIAFQQFVKISTISN